MCFPFDINAYMNGKNDLTLEIEEQVVTLYERTRIHK